MNSRIAFTALLTFGVTLAFAQDLTTFNQERLDLTRDGMLVLGSWAVANIISSPILASNATGSNRHFHQMNGYWNVVNLVIAGFGYYNAVTGDSAGLSLAESLSEQQQIEKLLLFNAGLDLAYIGGGLYMTERARRGGKNSDRLKGFGQSIMLQGAFLFAFDLVFYIVQNNHGSELLQLVDSLAFSPTGFRMVWTF